MLFLALIFGLAAIAMQMFTKQRKEVKPATALVYNNMWTGQPECILPGTDFTLPAIHRDLKEVKLINEVENPSNVKLITGDGVEIEVDYIVRRNQIGWPGMRDYSPRWPAADKERLRRCAIRAVTAIDYDERRGKILTRVVARLQEAIEHRRLNDLFEKANPKTGEAGKIKTEEKLHIEDEVNAALVEDIVGEKGWGFWVEIDLEDYNLPAVIRQARERKSSAKMAGKAMKEQLTAAGVSKGEVGKYAAWATIAETIANALRGKKGGE